MSFLLRLGFVALLWAFAWLLIQPRTQLMRLLRAAVLVLGLLTILVLTRAANL